MQLLEENILAQVSFPLELSSRDPIPRGWSECAISVEGCSGFWRKQTILGAGWGLEGGLAEVLTQFLVTSQVLHRTNQFFRFGLSSLTSRVGRVAFLQVLFACSFRLVVFTAAWIFEGALFHLLTCSTCRFCQHYEQSRLGDIVSIFLSVLS